MNKFKSIKIEQIKGISERMQEHLHAHDIYTIYDLLYFMPYRYENYEVVNIHTAIDNDKITVVGQIVSEPVFFYYRKNHSRLTFSLSINETIIKIVAFNRDFLKGKLVKGMSVTVTGKFERAKAQITATELKLSEIDRDRIEPVYSLKNLHKNYFLKVIEKVLIQYETYINDDLPLSLIQKYRLISSKDLFYFAHFPKNNEQVKQVMRRVKYEELLKFELKMMFLKDKERRNSEKLKKSIDERLVTQFVSNLPFELTSDQNHAITDILNDMKSDYQMNRLLQGDVGSGKTVVAATALYANYISGFQGCMMAPTEILAEQHYLYLKETFKDQLNIVLLTGSILGKARIKILEDLSLKKIDILVGTHALISEGVNFINLGLIIVDEQHRFGVNQRKILRDKGQSPDALFLSATPIPRTLALSVFGDMDLSSIKEMPKGRKPIKTYLIRSQLEKRLIQFIEDTVEKKQQVYIITPLIEESEKIDLENAMDVYEKYKQQFLGIYQVGLLHGKMSSTEKEDVMQRFKNNEIQILVSTTVVEVGVNVVNATLMIIIDAHRFGLAQLHQLRGRVGRSDLQSYCILVSDNLQDKTKERLEVLTKTNNGFEIAEADLKLRGPGDFFGSRQSGLPKFKMADIIQDYKILEVARNDAEMVISTKELFINPEYFALRVYIEQELMDNNEFFD